MKYEGEVRELELIPALVELGSEGFTGALRFENDSIIKIVYFKEGAVLSASTNDRSDSIDEILLKSGKVSRDHVKQALTKRKDDETLGDALLGLGFITRKELSWARRVQLIGILRSILGWDAGSYTLVADYLPKREEGPTFQLEQVVLELVLTDSDRSKFEVLLESGAAIYRPSDSFDEKFPSLGLNQEAEAVVRLVNGSRSAADVVSESTSDAFNVYKLMHALNLLGLLEKSSSGFDLGMGSPAVQSTIEPTVEMPMDFGSEVGNSESSVAPDDFDFGTPAATGVDLSWQGAEAPDTSTPSGDELRPSTEDEYAGSDSGYDYEPPAMDMSPEPSLLSDELGSAALVDEPISSPIQPPVGKPLTARQPHGGGGSGAGRKIAFGVVGVVIVAALAYAGYLYFMKPGAEPEPASTIVQQSPTPAAATAQDDTATELTSTDVALPPAQTETVAAKPAEAAPVKASTPPPAPKATPKPAPPAAAGRYAEMARANAADAKAVPYTVQFALLCQDYSIENAMKVGGSNFWFVPINYQGRNCYRAFWGRYASQADAENGVAGIPASLRGGKAVVVRPATLSN